MSGTTWRAEKWIGRARCFAVQEPDTGERHPLPLEGALPGELVRADDETTPYKRWLRTTEVLEPSPDRIEPSCPVAARCPGCSLLHTTEAAEDRYKALVVAEVFSRELGQLIAPDDVTIVAPARRGGHRAIAVVALEVTADGNRLLGLRARDRTVVHAPACPANHRLIAETLTRVLAWFPAELPPCRAEITVRVGVRAFDGPEATELTIRWEHGTPGSVTGALVDRLHELRAEPIAGVRMERADEDARAEPWRLGSTGGGLEALPIGALRLAKPLGAWAAPTPAQSEALYAWLLGTARRLFDERLDGVRALDVGCGMGGVSFTLAHAGCRVVGLDVDFRAVESARQTAHVETTERAGGIDATFRGGKAQTVLPRMVRDGERFDLVTINPFRSALGADAMRAVHQLGARAVIYLAPSAIAGAKDVHALREAGFRVAELGVANLHPGAHALLALAVLRRRQSTR